MGETVVKGRKVTILLVPDHGTQRTLKVSLQAMRLGLVLLVLSILLFFVMAATWMGLLKKADLAAQLAVENEQYRLEQHRVAELELRVNQLQQFEYQIRQALGAETSTADDQGYSPISPKARTDSTYIAAQDSRTADRLRPLAVTSVVPASEWMGVYKDLEIPSMWPTDGFISRGFEWNPILSSHSHAAVDIAGKEGAAIKATASGFVVWTGWSPRYGNLVLLSHRSGYFSVYGHNQIILVESRQYVARGQAIALLGNTGQSSAPHLHFEIWYKDQPLDPLDMLITL
jgi:murein DD-endopeptidase MepM/ murein hydrolase activator NlpD